MPQPSLAAQGRHAIAASRALKERVAAALAVARETSAHCDEVIARSRTAIEKTAEVFQHLRAAKERAAEQQRLRVPPPLNRAQQEQHPPPVDTRNEGRLYLQPANKANPKYKPIIPKQELTIEAVVIAGIRHFRRP